MRCPYTTAYWNHDINTADPRVAEHLASCAACRAELARQEMLRGLLAALPETDAPDAITQRLQAAALDAELTCAQTLDLLDAWREGDLDAPRAFLVEDHLLWCDSCRAALAQTEQLGALLHALPDLPAPAAIAERLEAARRPWWTRLALPNWQYGMATVAAMVLLALMTFLSPVTQMAKEQAPVHEAAVPQPSMTLPLAKPTVTYHAPATPRVTRPVARLGEAPAVSLPAVAPAVPQPITAHAKPATHVFTPTVFLPYRPTPREMALPTRTDTPHAAPVDVATKTNEPATAEYNASAREGMMRMTRDAELASVEESLSNAPEVMVASVPRRRPEVVELTPPAASDGSTDAHVARVDELRKAIVEDIHRTPTTLPKPIVVRNETTEKRADGVLFRIH